MRDVLRGEFEKSTKCEHLFVQTNALWAKPLLQAERENKSVYSRNVLSFSVSKKVIFFADAKSDISLTENDLARLHLAVIFYSPKTCEANTTRRMPNITAKQ